MQRVRMSLPYFSRYGWEAEIVTVDQQFSDLPLDNMLCQSISEDLVVHKIKAFPKKWTSKIGLGSLALRAMWFYFIKVNALLSHRNYDLIYFSTTQFPVMILGAYWKYRFSVPYIIDMQDLWHSEYYQNKPKDQRPAKHWFSYRLNKLLEPIAMRSVDGLISVSQGYLNILNHRYPQLNAIPQEVITFGAFQQDFDIANDKVQQSETLNPHSINVVYVGRGGHDFEPAFQLLLKAIEKSGVTADRIHFYFIGTSYAPNGSGKPSVSPLAAASGLQNYITELTDRIPFYETLKLLQIADALFIPGSDDENYTASKIYPYIMVGKPLLTIFHKNSSAGKIIKSCNAGHLFTFEQPEQLIVQGMADFISNLVAGKLIAYSINQHEFRKYSAESMTLSQVNVFNRVINS